MEYCVDPRHSTQICTPLSLYNYQGLDFSECPHTFGHIFVTPIGSCLVLRTSDLEELYFVHDLIKCLT